ncbi:MAG TPA: hypothetical protein VF017_20670 [Thermoanaerobaculia bacterium]|nr:hypothetical protein [Thermoanaerobaculia bacterium]
MSLEKKIFVRCGDRYLPPGDSGEWEVITLPGELSAAGLPEAVRLVRAAVRGSKHVDLLIAGPVALGVALGQALAHEPAAIDYWQLNQMTKELERWVSNRGNL